MNTKIKKLIAIHQPNLFPWLGFFTKIYQANEFIILDHTINNRSEAIYTRRVQLLNTQGKASFLTIPVKKIDGSDFGPINKWEINFDQVGFPRKQLESIKHTYSKHPYFENVYPLINTFFDVSSGLSLSERNRKFIEITCQHLEINTPFDVSSGLSSEGNSTELLLSIISLKNGTDYLSGKGGDKYQDPKMFEAAEIGLNRINFQHPIYPQLKSKEFIPGLSIIDCLMNIGFKETAKLIKLG
jgi:hypothetical protein